LIFLSTGKSNQPSSTKKDATVFYNNKPCGALLEIRRLQTTYTPKRNNTKPRTFLLLPKVPISKIITKSENKSPRPTVQQESENIKPKNCDQIFNSPRKKSLDINFKDKNNIVCKKIYLSEMRSRVVCGVPSAPPGTPSPGKKIDFFTAVGI
jgi:hypothetical protein